MTTIAVAAAERGAWEKTLAADGDTINFDRDVEEVRVTNVNGAASIYFTVGGPAVAAPVVGAAATYWLPAVAGASRTVSVGSGEKTTVKLDSAETPIYSVEGSL